jgi:hypothetical protein
MALSSDETEDNTIALDDAEEWEVIDTEVFDHTTNRFKKIPSTVFADDSVQQTLMAYVEKYKPTKQQIEQVKTAIGVLMLVAEFGFNSIKEPMVDWAEDVVQDKLACGLDELPRTLWAKFLDRMPERTRGLLVRVPRSVCAAILSSDKLPLTLDRTFRRQGFIEAPLGDLTHPPLPEAD